MQNAVCKRRILAHHSIGEDRDECALIDFKMRKNIILKDGLYNYMLNFLVVRASDRAKRTLSAGIFKRPATSRSAS